MLRSVREFHNYILAAEDGEIGRYKDFLFDDSTWTLRYMVADTGKWLPNRKVLISPASLGEPDWKSQSFRVLLSKTQIEESPALVANLRKAAEAGDLLKTEHPALFEIYMAAVRSRDGRNTG